MKRMIAMLLAIMLLFSSTGEILASEIPNTQGVSNLEKKLEFRTGLQEVEAIAMPENQMPKEVLDYREIVEINKYSAVYGNEWDKYSTNYYYNQLSPEWKAFWDAMDAVCVSYLNNETNITDKYLPAVSTPKGMTVSELQLLCQMFVYSNPQYYYLLNVFAYYWADSTKTTVSSVVLMSYDAFCNGADRKAATAKFKEQIETWETQVNACKTDEEKVKTIFDLICNKVVYNQAAANGTVEEEVSFSQSAYSVLCMDSTVCAGYADTMTIMCNGAGIDTISVSSYDHQWNKIRMNDSWYNYDATWGDQNDGIYYEFFARNDASYVDDGSSHVEEDIWEDYSPKATLDTAPSNPWVAPGTYPTIVNKTVTPKISVAETNGDYLVTITSDTVDTDIYYTLDGTEPSAAFTKSVKYTGPFTVSTILQVKAIAVKDTYWDSDIASYVNESKPVVSIAGASITLDQSNFVYNGKAKEPSVTVRVNNVLLSQGTDYTVTYENNKDAGTATIKITGIGNYEGTASTTFEIGKVALTVKAENVSKTYGQSDPTYTWKITSGQLVTGDTLTGITANRVAGENVGTYEISLTQTNGSNPNYAITFEAGSLEITPATILDSKVTLSETIYKCDGKEKRPTVTVMSGDKKLVEGTDYTVDYKDNKNIGTATVTITGKGNYTGTITQTFTIKLDKGDAFTSGKYKYKVTGSSTVAFNGITSTKTTKVSIPKTVKYGGKTFKVTSIADKALKGKTKVTQLTIGANVTKIGASAFAGCTKLSKVTMGSNVTSIGSSAFKGCTKLTKVSMGKKVKTIGVSAFEGCKKLSNVTIGSAVTTIDDKAFKNCTALKSITIPSKVTKIDKQAFYGCKNLKTITIKSTKLKTVGKEAFKKINSKATIKVPKSKLKSYQKLLKGKGQGSKVKIVK